MYHSDSRFYLRSLPFVGAILGFLLALFFFPDAVGGVADYLFNTNPEEEFSPNGWWLYTLIVPFCIAGLSRFDDNWIFILMLILFPPVLVVSYWLWELLAWALLGILFARILVALKDEGSNFVVLVIAVILYAICRVLGAFTEGGLSAIGDMLLIIILGGYMLITSLIDVFVYNCKFRPSGITILYVLVLCISLLGLSSLDKLSTTIATKKVAQTTTVQKSIYYCTAKSGINVRSIPSTSGKVIGKLKYGQAVEVLEEGSSFSKIKFAYNDGEIAWVSTQYLSKTKPNTTATTLKKSTSNTLTTFSAANDSKKTSASSQSDATTQVMKIYVNPVHATVVLTKDGKDEVFPVVNGCAMINIPDGNYYCQIRADGYYPYQKWITFPCSESVKTINLIKKS